jgi:hypothetical protein
MDQRMFVIEDLPTGIVVSTVRNLHHTLGEHLERFTSTRTRNCGIW